MAVHSKIVIDLTENLANVGEPLIFQGEFHLPDELLPYPQAKLTKVEIDFDVTFENPNVFIEGEITCFIDGVCDRCLAKVSKQIYLPFEQTFYNLTYRLGNSEYTDKTKEEDAYIYSGSKLDVTQAVCDEIVLSLPLSFLCKEDCKGLCHKCGTDLNKQTCSCDTTPDNAFSVLKNLKF